MARNFPVNVSTDSLSNTAITALSTTAGTVGFWFKPNWSSGDSVWHQIFIFWNTSTNTIRLEMLHFTDNNVYVGFYNGAGRATIADTGLFTNGTWTYITLTYTNAPLMTCYFNAVSKGTDNTATQSGLTKLEVGNSFTSQTFKNTCTGSISDFTVWNTVLSVPEITALSRHARPHTIRPASLVHFWEFNRGQSPEPDSTIVGNANLTVSGTSFSTGPALVPSQTFLTTVNSGEAFLKRSPLVVAAALPKIKGAAAASSVVFRKTLSQIGGRVGSRQIQGWAN